MRKQLKSLVPIMGCIAFIIIALATAKPPSKKPREAVTIKVTLVPEIRCLGEDLAVTWECSNPNYGFTLRSNSNPETVLHDERASSGSAFIPSSALAGLPNQVTLIFRPNYLDIGDDVATEKIDTKVELLTITGTEEVIRPAVIEETPSGSGNFVFKVNLPAAVWSSNIMVSEISVVKGCDGEAPQGKYGYDKGLATQNPNTLTNENGFRDVLTKPVSAVGVWIIHPLSKQCNKDDNELEVKFKVVCPTP